MRSWNTFTRRISIGISIGTIAIIAWNVHPSYLLVNSFPLTQVTPRRTSSKPTLTFISSLHSSSIISNTRTALFERKTNVDAKNNKNKKKNGKPEKPKVHVKTLDELERHFNTKNGKGKIDHDALLASMVVEGDTQKLGSVANGGDLGTTGTKTGAASPFLHSVQQILHDRRRHVLNNNNNSNTTQTTTPPTDKGDNHKVALVVEGGGMRGCVSAGMVTAIFYLGLEDTFDVIYGSSAGTIIGAYFNTRQLPWFGPEIYYDSLTTADKKFIDSKRLLRSLGLGLVDPRLLKDVITRPRFGKPVLNLDYLLRDTMQIQKPLNWTKFVEMQNVQPLKVVSSGLHCGTSVVLDYENGGFKNIQELALAMRSSCLLPGIAGPIVNVQKEHLRRNNKNNNNKKYIVKNNLSSQHKDDYEPLADALVYEPLPYQTALNEGATHVVTLRSRPDGNDVSGKTSIFEKLIFHRFFRRKNKLRHIYDYMRSQGHKKLYAKQIIELNDASNDEKSNMIAIAVPPGSPEVPRLETGREAIFEGVRRGFARAYDCLVEDPNERGRGAIVAKQLLPDEILDYDPLLIDSGDESAFKCFLEQKEKIGEGYDFPPSLGKTALEADLPR